ncbi:MFS transporter [Nocardia pseudovaccinii]|uniref:MFS transporter n=1 Tax=Nocardia pseudovaccinii TaxID=189540 RepID=UPI0007A4ADB3|nr:MFS transporter [Nocardia pseudovaccinii]
MLVGAPALAMITLRWPRRTALLAFLGVFIAAHVVAALTPGYSVLFGTRVVGAFVYAGFWAVAATTALRLSTGALLVIFGYLGALLARTTGMRRAGFPWCSPCTALAR